MEAVMQDLRYGFRMLVKNPTFTFIAVLALALGIGANTAIFSVVNVMLLRPLPFADSDQLVAVWTRNVARSTTRGSTAPPDFRAWQEQNAAFQGLGAYYLGDFNISARSEPERVRGAFVTSNLFPLLGTKPALGRLFSPEEEKFGQHRVAILGHGLWQRRFGSDPNLIGQQVTLNSESYTVVGVMPPDTWLRQAKQKAELWIPMAFEPGSNQNTRNNYFLNVIGRLKPGVEVAQAQAKMDVIAGQLAQDYKENAGLGARVVSLSEDTSGDNRPILLILLGAVGCVLLIACANVANLLLSRAASRERETALRIALGASRGRLIRQWLTENIMMSVLGGALGLALAAWGLQAIVALAPENLSRTAIITQDAGIAIDHRVLIFTMLLSVLTGVIFGLLPVLQASNPDLNKALKDSGRSTTGSARSRRMRGVLVVSEIALALVLLVGAGLMLKSFMRMQSTDPGFNSEKLLTMQIALPELKYKEARQRTAFFQQAIERIKGLPGVQSVGATTGLPMSNESWGKQFSIEGHTPPTTLDQVEAVEFHQATPDYFRAAGISLLKGRFFTEQDTQDSPGVVIINEAAAKKFFPGEDPIGKRVWMGPPESMLSPTLLPPGGQFPRATVVGMIRDVMSYGVDKPVEWEVFAPYQHGGGNIPLSKMYVAVRTTGDPLALSGAVRGEVRALDPDQPVADLKTMEQRLSDSLWQPRFNMILLLVLAGVAAFLASIGIYGVVSYSVAQRTPEIGVRVALGAQPRDVMKLIMRQGFVLAFVGLGIGLAAAFGLSRVLSSLLYGVSSTDVSIFALVTLLLLTVTLLGSFIPARRAMKVDPLTALRNE
ncbi:MAG TPA: ABC transporter permease [Pyrinomonadaceae bacterium]|nr:ABC transporter permease [Pyrinomonadaceae bacterium]